MSDLQRFSLGLTARQIADADALAEKFSEERGGKWSRADVIREALRRMSDRPTAILVDCVCSRCGATATCEPGEFCVDVVIGGYESCAGKMEPEEE